MVRNTKCIKKLDFSISSEDFYNTTVKLGSSIPTSKCGELNGYEYLLENTKYSTGTRDAYWIENPFSNISGYAYRVQSCGVLGSTGIDNAGSYGVRPAIEVQKSNIEY